MNFKAYIMGEYLDKWKKKKKKRKIKQIFILQNKHSNISSPLSRPQALYQSGWEAPCLELLLDLNLIPGNK